MTNPINNERHAVPLLLTVTLSLFPSSSSQVPRPSRGYHPLKLRLIAFRLVGFAYLLAVPFILGWKAAAADGDEASTSRLVLPSHLESSFRKPATPATTLTARQKGKPARVRVGKTTAPLKERNRVLSRLQYRLNEHGLDGSSLRREVPVIQSPHLHPAPLAKHLQESVHKNQALFLNPSTDRQGRLIAFPYAIFTESDLKRVT